MVSIATISFQNLSSKKFSFMLNFSELKKMITLQLPFQKVFKLLMTKHTFQVTPLHLGGTIQEIILSIFKGIN